jgi:hypothetical protein
LSFVCRVNCISFLMCKHSKTVCVHNNLTFAKTDVYIYYKMGHWLQSRRWRISVGRKDNDKGSESISMLVIKFDNMLYLKVCFNKSSQSPIVIVTLCNFLVRLVMVTIKLSTLVLSNKCQTIFLRGKSSSVYSVRNCLR